jgi:hypothetical protein
LGVGADLALNDRRTMNFRLGGWIVWHDRAWKEHESTETTKRQMMLLDIPLGSDHQLQFARHLV